MPLLLVLIGVAAATHCVRVGRRHAGGARTFWLILSADAAAFSLGWLPVAAGWVEVDPDGHAAVVGLVSLLGFVAAMTALLSLNRPGRATEALLDGAAVGVTLAVVLWETSVQAAWAQGASTTIVATKLLRVPLLAALLVIALLMLSAARRARAVQLLTIGTGLLLANDVVRAALTGLEPTGTQIAALGAIAPIPFLLAAILHPTREQLTRAGDPERPSSSPLRLSLMGAVVAVPALGLLLVGDGPGDQVFYGLATLTGVLSASVRVTMAALGQAADRAALRAARDDVARRARVDALTGLASRFEVERRVRELAARVPATPFAITFIDLDNFKRINDAFGHHAGDLALQGVAGRLTAAVRTDGLVGRFGGDEFVVVLPGVNDTEVALRRAHGIRRAIASLIDVGGQEVHLAASVGVALSDGRHDAGAVLRDADAAMYAAKHSPDGVLPFDDRMREALMRDLEVEQRLRGALDAGTLEVVYQAMASVTHRDRCVVEALVRWPANDPDRLTPDEFVPVAERSGLIHELGRFVRRRVAVDWAAWATDGLDVDVSVNVSSAELHATGFAEDVAVVLSAHQMPADRLTLEITERDLLADEALVISLLHHLRDRGIQVALDDFGTGYFSLSQLRSLPVDVLKIDRTFVEGLGTDGRDETIVRAVVAMGGGIGLVTVAEGVETPSQLAAAIEIGVDRIQGFVISEPVAAERVPQVAPTVTRDRGLRSR